MPSKDMAEAPQLRRQAAESGPSSDFANRVRTLGIKQLESVHDGCHIPDGVVNWAASAGLHVSLQAASMIEEGKMADYAMVPVLAAELGKDLMGELHFCGYRQRADGTVALSDCILCVQGEEVRAFKLRRAVEEFQAQDNPLAVRAMAAELSGGINPTHGHVEVEKGFTLREFIAAPKGEVHGIP